MPPTRAAPSRWHVAACLAVLALALTVAGVIKRRPANFSALPPLALVRDRQQHKLWAIRVAPAAHQIAVDAADVPPLPDGHAYQLWLSGPKGAHSLGLLPTAGRKIIPERPALIARLDAGRGEFTVTLEPARGSITGRPSGPALYHARWVSDGPRGSGCAMIASVSGLR
jgi:anti-sigma-K factor RskA